MKHKIYRKFVDVDGRLVHYWLSGKGKPIILLHASPQDGSFVLEPFHELTRNFQLIAIDTAGFGLSEPLAIKNPKAIDFANATITTLQKLKINQYILYGTHTGAHIALEVAISSSKVKYLIIDGISFYNSAEKKELLKKYAPKFTPHYSGGHLVKAWHHTRDQTLYYPWFNKTKRIKRKLPSSSYLHKVVIAKLRADIDYIKGYRAAFSHNTKVAFKKLKTKTLLYSRSDDVLEKHVNRINKFNPNINIINLNNRNELIESIKNKFSRIKINNYYNKSIQPTSSRYIVVNGSQQLVRIFGEDKKNPIILLHGIGGNSLSNISLQKFLSKNRKVISFDIPGNGFSDNIKYKTKISSYSKNLILILNRLKLKKISLIAFDASASLAINTLNSYPSIFESLILIKPIILKKNQKKNFVNNFFPNLKPNNDGTQLNTAWNFLMDSKLFWPWFKGGQKNIRDLSPYRNLKKHHQDFIQLMTASESYHYYSKACFSFNQEDIRNKIYNRTLLLGNKKDLVDEYRKNILKSFEKPEQIEMPITENKMAKYIEEFLKYNNN